MLNLDYNGTLMQTGRIAEQHAYDFLVWCGCSDIQDVRCEYTYQQIDVDYLATWQGREWKFEVKSDAWISKTNNFVFEERRTYANGYTREGWSVFSRADVFLVYSPSDDVLWSFRADAIRQAYASHGNVLNQHVTQSSELFSTQNVFIPIELIEGVKKFKRLPSWHK